MNKVHKFIVIFCILGILLASFFGCAKEEENIDIYKGKECINCSNQATHHLLGPKPPFDANDKNFEETVNIPGANVGTTGSVGRIFYCDECYSKIPMA